eukprot:9311574-Alexandrium_andersonii.AAC.1
MEAACKRAAASPLLHTMRPHCRPVRWKPESLGQHVLNHDSTALWNAFWGAALCVLSGAPRSSPILDSAQLLE